MRLRFLVLCEQYHNSDINRNHIRLTLLPLLPGTDDPDSLDSLEQVLFIHSFGHSSSRGLEILVQ